MTLGVVAELEVGLGLGRRLALEVVAPRRGASPAAGLVGVLELVVGVVAVVGLERRELGRCSPCLVALGLAEVVAELATRGPVVVELPRSPLEVVAVVVLEPTREGRPGGARGGAGGRPRRGLVALEVVLGVAAGLGRGGGVVGPASPSATRGPSWSASWGSRWAPSWASPSVLELVVGLGARAVLAEVVVVAIGERVVVGPA